MISLLHLNKFILFVLFLIIVNLKPAFGEDEILTKDQIDIVSFYVSNSVSK